MTPSSTTGNDVAELLARWDSGEGKPYKGSLINWGDYKRDPANIGCMCAQGQVLHLLAGWSPERLLNSDQEKADKATAKLLGISIAHSILLRSINDKADGAPSVVLTNPEKILGDQAHIVLAFWRHLDRMKAKDWKKVVAAREAAWKAAGEAAWKAARKAAGEAAWKAAREAAREAAGEAAGEAARADGWEAAGACNEIQGARILREQGKPFFFLPMFGFADPEAIPPLPADYGVSP